MKKILCLGSATKDVFVGLRETRIIDNPQEIQAQKLMAFEFGAKEYAESLQEEIGGSALNVATGLTLLGQKAFLLSRVDKGETGQWILKKAGKNKIKKNYAQKVGGQPGSETSVIISDRKNGDHIIFRFGDSTDAFDWNKFAKKFKEKADWLLVASQKAGWKEKQKAIEEFVQKKKIKLAFNPSSYQISRAKETLTDFLPKVDLLFLNKDEAIELALNLKKKTITNDEELLEELLGWGIKNVALTDGIFGAWAANQKEKFFLPAIKTTVAAETVGAGDAFAAGFLAYFSQKEDLKMALAAGIGNSAGTVKKIGATKGLLSAKELKYVVEKIVK